MAGPGTIPDKGTDRPTLKYLNKYVRPHISTHWLEIGIELLDIGDEPILEIFRENYPNNSNRCASEMLQLWLNKRVEASWNILIQVLRQPHIGLSVLASKIENMLVKEEDISFKELTSENFLEKYLRAKYDLGSEELKLLKILFFGPPGAGKTTLLSVLLNLEVQSYRESTGVLDRKLVQFKVAVQRDVEKAISQWKIVKINEEILRLRHTIEEKLGKRTSEYNKRSLPDSESKMKIDKKLANIYDVIPDSENQDQMSSLQQQYKISNTLMACYDSGGQPEFFDVMPAFISATTGNIMIFDMSKDLHSPLDPEFYKKGQPQGSSNIKTHYTGAQLLKTALANIQSYATQYTSCSSVNGYFESSELLVVGTHLDQCGDTEDKKCEKLHTAEEIIHDVLRDCSGISVIKRPRGRITKIVYPIASKCDKETNETVRCRKEVAQEIRTAIESMSEKNINKEVPISWLLFQYEIKLHSVPWIWRSECEKIAENCYIDKNDIDIVLQFFHELGILLYYQDKEINNEKAKEKMLSHVIFSDPQWLFAQLTKLIELKYDPSCEAAERIKKGFFSRDFLRKIYGKEFHSSAKGVLHYESIINIFVHLNIMARLSDATEQYFMPALLNPFPNDISIDATFGTKVLTTLYVKFNNGYFPRGVFCCLIALSIKQCKHWSLQPNAAYKDLIVFQIDNKEEYLILFDKIHYVSVEIHCKEELLQNNHHVLCHTLYNNLKEVCNTIHLKGEFKFGFLCEEPNCEKIAYIQMQYPCPPKTLLCSACEHKSTMTYDQLVWFVPPEVIDIFNKSKAKSSKSSSYGKQKLQRKESSDLESDSDNNDNTSSSKLTKRRKGSPQDIKLSNQASLLAQKVQMWELTKYVIPKINANWEELAYCMRYSIEEVEGFRKGSEDLKERCKKLLINWLTTDHVPKPKTYQTLLNHIKEIDDLNTASEVIEKELIKALDLCQADQLQ